MYSLSVWDYHGKKLTDLKNKNVDIHGSAYGGQFKENINGLKELEFILPLYVVNEQGDQEENFRWDYIQAEYLIKLEFRGKYDWFIIKTFNDERTDNGGLFSNIQCKHIANLLTQSGLNLNVDMTANAKTLLDVVLDNSGWTIGEIDTFRADGIEKIRTLKIDRSNIYNAIQELAELFEAYPRFNPDKTVDFKENIGNNNGVVFKYGKNLKNVKRIVGNNGEVITKLWVEGGSDDVGLVTISSVNPTGENYILDFSYFIDGGFLNQEQLDAISSFESSVGSVNDSISGELGNISTAQNTLNEKKNQLEFDILSKSTKQQRKDEIDMQIQTETDANKKETLQTESNQLQDEINALNTTINSLNSEIASLESDIASYESALGSDFDNKQNMITDLHTALGDFIREGLWQDSNYIDTQALYDDALKQSKIYAYPQVAYEMSVLDLSTLTGYEIEKFGLGDIIRIIDKKLRLDTLGRITEVNTPLDKPQNVSVQIGNYYSNFEDLFKRISEASEIIKQRQEIYERSVGINPDGTVNYDVLQKTFDNNKFRVVNGTNNYVEWDESGLTVTDLVDENKKLRINSGGIFITTDGGETWKVGMSPEGYSALNMTSGVIDTKLLQIWNSEEPKFKWAEDGIIAFGEDINGNTDPNKWIKYSKDGFHFTRDNGATYDISIGWDGVNISLLDSKVSEAESGANNYTDSKVTVINDNHSALTQTVNSINQTVGSHSSTITDLGNDLSAVETRVQNAEQEVTKDKIISKVSDTFSTKTEVNEAVNEIEVGGRNLVLLSDKFNVGSYATGIASSITDEGYLQVISQSSNGNWHTGWYKSLVGIEDNFVEDDVFTISFTIKRISGTGTPTIYIKNGMGYYSLIGNLNSDFSKLYYCGTWKKLNGIVPYLGWSGTVGTFVIKNWKLEKGNKATDWTPAPEDTQDQIDNVSQRVSSAEQKILPKAITNTVRSSTEYIDDLGEKVNTNEVISKINQTAEEVQIDANRLRIGAGTTYEQGRKYTWNDYKGYTWQQLIVGNAIPNSGGSTILNLIPTYWHSHLQSKINTIKNLQTDNSFSFGFVTDTHYSDNANQSSNLMEYIMQQTQMPYFIHGGDSYDNWSTVTKDYAKRQIAILFDVFKNIKSKMLYTMGNHDDNSITARWVDTLTEIELYRQFFSHLDKKVVKGESGKYYYADDKTSKVRYVVLDSHDIPYIQVGDGLKYQGQWTCAFRQEQLAWFGNVALNVPSNEWSVVVCSHISPYGTGVTGHDMDIRNTEMARGILQAFKNRTSFSGSSLSTVETDFKANVNVDFTGKGGNVVCWLSGHVHYDNIVTMPEGIKLITTINDSLSPWSTAPSKTKGTITEQAFDIFTVDKASKNVNITRIGAGANRQFTYE